MRKKVKGLLLPVLQPIGNIHHGIIQGINSNRIAMNSGEYSRKFWYPQHLYILDPTLTIKNDDWCFYQDNNFCEIVRYRPIHHTNKCTKIIATTDITILGDGLPSISPLFLSMYVTTQGKGYIFVEAELNKECWDCHNFGDPWADSHYDNFELNGDNDMVLHITEDGIVWDEIALGNPQPCVLTCSEDPYKFTEEDMMNALRAAVFSVDHAKQWLTTYKLEKDIP